MDASNNIHPTRRVSDRKSKPSMEALVDHHKRIYWGGPSTPVSSASRHHEQPQHPVSPSAIQISLSSLDGSDRPNEHNSLAQPLRIRLHLSRVEVPTVVLGSHISPSFPSSGPTPETRISPGPLPKQTLPSDFPSSGLQNGAHVQQRPLRDPIEVAMEEDANDDDEEDNLPLTDLCKRVAAPHPHVTAAVVAPPEPPPLPQPPPLATCWLKTCHNPLPPLAERWDGQFCSCDCLVKACRQAFKAYLSQGVATPNHQAVS
nr:unnamed protein product [Spirometra erinaceieuropaei]